MNLGGRHHLPFCFGTTLQECSPAHWMGGTMGWGEQAVLQLKCNAAIWAMHRFPMSMPIEWFTLGTELTA